MLANSVPLFDLFRADRRALQLERAMLLENPSTRAQLASSRDSYGALSSQRTALEREPFLCMGRVGDPIAYTHFYKIRLYREGGIIPACMATQTSHEVSGAHQMNVLMPGTQVVVMWAPHMPFGIILGVVPDFMLSPLDAMGDRVVQGSRVGLQVDSYHNFAFNLVMAGGIIDWSAGRPNDQITTGEWGATTETGLMFFLDPFMMMMRVDEETGVFGFYDDQMLRVAGHNLELRSSGYERTDDDDEWEFDITESCVPGYLWEGRGAFDLADQDIISTSHTTEEVQLTIPWYAETEPYSDHQQPIRRYRKFMGYLGQGYKRTLFILPEPGSADRDEAIPGLQQITDETRFPGVAEEQWGLDGFISQRSAKGIILSKRILIPEPKRVKLEEDTSGDTATNYSADGVFGMGPPHLISDIAYPTCQPTNLLQAAAFFDLYAHVFNWRGLHPFYYHTRDIYMPDETDYWFASLMVTGNPPFSDCVSPSAGMLAPLPLMFTVDSRYGQIMYFPNNSYMALLDDGGVVIGDGYGSEIRMTAGNIYETAANDIYALPGRNWACWAGHDFVARANWNAHMTANNCNVFIKAQNKLMMMGGNDVCGGVLIESKAPVTQFDVSTPPNLPPTGTIAQSGGFRNAITASVNCSGYVPPPLKDIITICCVVAGSAGTALCNIVDTANKCTATDVTLELTMDICGCEVIFSGDDFVVGQEWTISVTADANDINDEIISGIVIRAKESTVFTYAANIEDLLSHDGIGGMMVYDAGQYGMHIEHGSSLIRHTENDMDDIFWTTSSPELIVLFESTGAIKDPSQYFGPSVTYTITCIEANLDQPINAARVSVNSSLDDDSATSIVVSLQPVLTAIGNRGFRWSPTAENIIIGDTWAYVLFQTYTPCVNSWNAEYAGLCQNLCANNIFASCVMSTGNISTLASVLTDNMVSLTANDASAIQNQAAICTATQDAYLIWAIEARTDLTVIKDSTKVTRMEFFFPSSYQDGTEPPWKIFETRWQQMDRLQSGSAESWSENPVVGGDASAMATVSSYPWPGKYSWLIWQTYYQENVNLFELNNNLLADRGSAYEPPVSYDSPSTSALDGTWGIIENPC